MHEVFVECSYGNSAVPAAFETGGEAVVVFDGIHRILAENETRFGVSQGEGGIPDRFIALIQSAEAKFGQRAVVLGVEFSKKERNVVGWAVEAP